MAPTNLDWDNIAASADGQRIIACAGGEPGWVYSSPDAGVTWFTNNLPDLGWAAVASSADGSKLFAVAVFGGIYISTDFGVSWSPTQAPVNDWGAVSSSADGSKLAAAVGAERFFEGSIFISTDSGTNWAQSEAPTTNWSAITASADGTKLAAAVGLPQTGPIYNSSDSGATWTTNNNAPDSSWVAVASSADGQKLVAVAQGASGIFTSPNGGAQGISNAVPQNIWWSVASSADGNRLVAVVVPDQATNGGIYTAYLTPSPQLAITGQPSASTLVSWVVPSTHFTLQQSPDLFTWVNVPNSPVLNLASLQEQVVLPVTAGNAFYRLKTP